jgi:hypothetical protein
MQLSSEVQIIGENILKDKTNKYQKIPLTKK